jgi:hypothetical protein
MKEASSKAVGAIVEAENLPKDAADLFSKMIWMPTYISRWRYSAARSAMNRAFALVKVHHPDVDLPVVASGIPELKEDGTPLTTKEFHEVGRSLRGLATTAAQKLKLDKFFYPCDADNEPIKMVEKSQAKTTPVMATPLAVEPPRPSAPAK